MPKITVYTTPSCVQCRSTKKHLKDKLGLEFDEVDISVDLAALEMVKSLGHNRAPVVIAGNESWSGFQPDRLDALAA